MKRVRLIRNSILNFWLVWIMLAFFLSATSFATVRYDHSNPDPQSRNELVRKAPYLLYNGNITEMEVLWQLDTTATATIAWGLDETCSLGSSISEEYGDDHQHLVTLSDLSPATKYYYRVTVADTAYCGSFRSAPADTATGSKVMVIGDSQCCPDIHDSVAAAMISAYTADEEFQTLCLAVGDIVNNGDLEEEWDEQLFHPAYSNIQNRMAQVPFMSARGNHEGTGVLFEKYFPYPHVDEFYWSYDYGPVHFAVIDQYTSLRPGLPEMVWLEEDLSSTEKPWKIVYLHEPGWSSGGVHGNNEVVQEILQPLFIACDVSMVLAGHNHYYARAVVNGIQHVTTGGGGAELHTPESNYPNVVVTAESYHFCKIDLTAQLLHFEAVAPDGTILDSLTLRKGCQITLTPSNPPVTIPSTGGSFDFNITAVNTSEVEFTADVWCNLTLPSGAVYGPTISPINILFSPGFSGARDRTQAVPDTAPPGSYTFNGYVGAYPDVIWDLDSFEFEKLEAGDGPIRNGHSNFSTPLENWEKIPTSVSLHSCRPNPFNPSTVISYQLSVASHVNLSVYNISGRKIAELVNGWRDAGLHEVTFDAFHLASGLYVLCLNTADFTSSGKLLTVK